jgi:LPXTG-motif cell wall-anchored protein
MKSSVKATLLAGALFAAATVPALSQTANPPATGGAATESQAQASDDDNDDDGSDFGWIGLLGLAGLAGLMGRKRDHHVRTTTTGTTHR